MVKGLSTTITPSTKNDSIQAPVKSNNHSTKNNINIKHDIKIFNYLIYMYLLKYLRRPFDELEIKPDAPGSGRLCRTPSKNWRMLPSPAHRQTVADFKLMY